MDYAKVSQLSAGPWRATLRRFGYLVHDPDGRIVASVGSGKVTASQKRDAIAIATLPDLLAVLVACENYFGDRPAKDSEARALHERLFQVLVQAGVPVASPEEEE